MSNGQVRRLGQSSAKIGELLERVLDVDVPGKAAKASKPAATRHAVVLGISDQRGVCRHRPLRPGGKRSTSEPHTGRMNQSFGWCKNAARTGRDRASPTDPPGDRPHSSPRRRRRNALGSRDQMTRTALVHRTPSAPRRPRCRRRRVSAPNSVSRSRRQGAAEAVHGQGLAVAVATALRCDDGRPRSGGFTSRAAAPAMPASACASWIRNLVYPASGGKQDVDVATPRRASSRGETRHDVGRERGDGSGHFDRRRAEPCLASAVVPAPSRALAGAAAVPSRRSRPPS